MVLKFTHPLWGIHSHLCTVYKRSREPILEGGFIARPDGFTRFVFRLTYGLRDYLPLALIRCNRDPRDAIRFYECYDRSGRRRRFVYATNCNSDGGGSFVICDSYFEELYAELTNLDKEFKANENAPSDGDTHPV
jgi:hypothetical protein